MYGMNSTQFTNANTSFFLNARPTQPVKNSPTLSHACKFSALNSAHLSYSAERAAYPANSFFLTHQPHYIGRRQQSIMLPAKSSLFPYYELLFLGTKIPPSNLFSNTFVVREMSERLTAVVSTLRPKRPNSQNTGILYFVNVLPLELEADRRDEFTHYFVLNVCTFQFQARYWNIKRFCMQRRKEGFEFI